MLKIKPSKQLQIVLISLVFTFTINAQVGIGNDNPITTLDVNGAIGLREGGTLDLATGNNDNINLGTPAYSVYRIVQTGAAGTINIGGIAPIVNNSVNGQILILQNTTTQAVVIQHEVPGNGARRIQVPGGQDLILSGQYSTVTLMYNDIQNRWIIVSHDQNDYGKNIQSVVGSNLSTIYATIDPANTPYILMTDMTLTFTPKHSTVYVNFSASGYVNSIINNTGLTTRPTLINFELRNGTNTEATTITLGTDYDDVTGVLTSWNAGFTMFPISVTPGASTTISIRWRGETLLGSPYPSTTNPAIICDPSTDYLSHRNLTIID